MKIYITHCLTIVHNKAFLIKKDAENAAKLINSITRVEELELIIDKELEYYIKFLLSHAQRLQDTGKPIEEIKIEVKYAQ